MHFLTIVAVVTHMSLCTSFMIQKSSSSGSNVKSLVRMSASSEADYALLFDCDGVIVETEELHRLAYNEAFKLAGVQLPSGQAVEWTVPYYDILQNTVGGGKPKMMHYFNNEVKVWPSTSNPVVSSYDDEADRVKLVDYLQDLKTGCYKAIIDDVASARPGVLELMDAAIADPRLKVGICSAATKAGFEKLVNKIVGKERLAKLDCIIAGDDVPLKKPDPLIYNTAQKFLGIPADRCVVIEDSIVGLKAAKGAGMRCIITYTDSTATEDFYALDADAKVPNLAGITVQKIFGATVAAVISSPAVGGKSYGVSRAANAFYAQTRTAVETKAPVRALGELLPNDKDPKVPMPVKAASVAPTVSVSAAKQAVEAFAGWTPNFMVKK